MSDIDLDEAKKNRERVAKDRDRKPYYWYEENDPFGAEVATSNPDGLARSKLELKNRRR